MPQSAFKTLPKRDVFFAERTHISAARFVNGSRPTGELREAIQNVLLECPECGENMTEMNVHMDYSVNVTDDFNPVTGDSERQDEGDSDNTSYCCRECGHELDSSRFIYEIYNSYYEPLEAMGITNPLGLLRYIQNNRVRDDDDITDEDEQEA